MDDTMSVQSFSRDDAKQSYPKESPVHGEHPKEKKCANLTFNFIYQICDILVALSLIFWAYCLSPKSFNTFSNEASLAMFMSRLLVTLYFAAFSITIILCTFYYPFKTKSIYFTFYGRGLFFLFLGNLMLLIASISNDDTLSTPSVSIYDYGYYTAHYVVGIAFLYLLIAIISNPKFGAKCCFLPSPWMQLKNAQRLHFKMSANSDYHSHEINKSEEQALPMEKQLSIVVELAADPKIDENNQSKNIRSNSDIPKKTKNNNGDTSKLGYKNKNNISSNVWIQNDKKNQNENHNQNNNDVPKLELNKRKSLNDIKKTKVIMKEIKKRNVPQIDRRNTADSFQNRLSIFKNNAAGMSDDKIDKLKNERKEHDKDMKQDHESKRRATIAIQTYATQAAAHSQDINLLNKSLKNVTKKNCMEKMREMGLLFGVYVPINEYQRWDIRSKLDKIIHKEDIKEEDRDDLNAAKKSNSKEYVKMHVFNLRNNALLTKISKEQKADFYKLIEYSIQTVPRIYMMDFTRANANKAFINIAFEALAKRSNSQFGPEEILLESNPITDNGCIEIVNYLSKNPPDLRVLRLSNSFHNIGSQTVVSFCEVMEKNKNIIKFSLDISYLMYNNRMDGYIKRNNNLWRENKKSNPANLIKRESYDFLIKRHKKARRSSVPNLHQTHPSLALIRGGFNLDKQAKKNKTKSKKKDKKSAKNKHVKRRSSVPDAAEILRLSSAIPVAMPMQSRNRYNFNLKSKVAKKNITKKKETKKKSVVKATPKKIVPDVKVEEESSSSSDDDLNDLMSGNIFKNAYQDTESVWD